MAAVVTLTVAFLICQVKSQIVNLGPSCQIPRRLELTTPCATEIYRQSPVGTDPCGITAQSFLVPLSNTVPVCQQCKPAPAPPIFNLPVPPCIQNQVPIINQPVISPVLQSVSNCLPKCPNIQVTPVCVNTPQLTPSVSATPATPPVVTVVDNTLATTLANALQLLIISNLLENTGTCNLAQNIPCINNYEVVTPDFAVPAISCEYLSTTPEPVFSCPEPTCSCPEPVFSCSEPVFPCLEPVVFQPCPTNFGGPYSITDNCGVQCVPNQLFLETPPQFVAQVAPVCSLPIAPALSTIAPIAPPMALEVPFPAEIPAQLTCNFGVLPSNEPCVTFTVEALPSGNVFGNFGNCLQY